MTEADYVIVTSTMDTEEAAVTLASLIVENKLAACVQHFPIKSTYRWEGKIENSSEYLLSAKTVSEKANELIDFIKNNHSYDIPEIIATPIESGHPDYLNWIKTETK